jgi:hypothetical protein
MIATSSEARAVAAADMRIEGFGSKPAPIVRTSPHGQEIAFAAEKLAQRTDLDAFAADYGMSIAEAASLVMGRTEQETEGKMATFDEWFQREIVTRVEGRR